MLSMFVLLASTNVNANSLDDKIVALSQDKKTTTQGQTLFNQMCASCHSKDLSGASGFNLKDGEWIHGSQPSSILSNIKKGFAKAGMPGFDAVYSEAELQSIVAYVLSKRVGFDKLTYKIYQMTDKNDKVIKASKLIKQGSLANNFADFQLPEIQNYIIEFEGDFYTFKDQVTQIWVQWGKRIDLTVEVNGKQVKREGEWDPVWKLARGKQHLKLSYHSGKNKLNQRNLPLIVTNDDLSIKLFPISTRARAIMAEKKVEVKAVSKTIVQRKKVMKVPPYSVSVGLPAKINYAFNTRTCAIVGLWQGDLLNVGPNVGGRGQDGSLPLGDWVFHSPNSVNHQATNTKCMYKGYQMIDQEPVFNYQIAGVEYALTARATNDHRIDFHYQITSATKAPLTINLPQRNKLSWLVSKGKINDSKAFITPDTQGGFTVSAQINK